MVFKRGKSVPGGASGVGSGIDTWRLAAAIGDSGLNPNPKRRRECPDGPDYEEVLEYHCREYRFTEDVRSFGQDSSWSKGLFCASANVGRNGRSAVTAPCGHLHKPTTFMIDAYAVTALRSLTTYKRGSLGLVLYGIWRTSKQRST